MIKGVAAVWLPVTNMERAVSFYGDTLGLPSPSTTTTGARSTPTASRSGSTAPSPSPRAATAAPSWRFSPTARSSAVVHRLSEAGVEFADGISEHPWGQIVPFKDPDGNDLQLYEPPSG